MNSEISIWMRWLRFVLNQLNQDAVCPLGMDESHATMGALARYLVDELYAMCLELGEG